MYRPDKYRGLTLVAFFMLLGWIIVLLTTVCEEEEEDGGEDVGAIHGWVPPAPGDLVRAVMAASATPQALRGEDSQDTGAAMSTQHQDKVAKLVILNVNIIIGKMGCRNNININIYI